MRTIYLFRHGLPEFPGGIHLCLGLTPDLPLSAAGRAEAAAWAEFLGEKHVTAVYTSPALRARETAAALSGGKLPVKIAETLHEMCYGEWEGMRFDDIKARYAELYARRGNDMSLMPPGGESVEAAGQRGVQALRAILADSQGNLAIAAHAGLIRATLWRLSGIPAAEIGRFHQDYARANILTFDGEKLSVQAVNQRLDELT